MFILSNFTDEERKSMKEAGNDPSMVNHVYRENVERQRKSVNDLKKNGIRKALAVKAILSELFGQRLGPD
jgi:hypothetical protein